MVFFGVVVLGCCFLAGAAGPSAPLSDRFVSESELVSGVEPPLRNWVVSGRFFTSFRMTDGAAGAVGTTGSAGATGREKRSKSGTSAMMAINKTNTIPAIAGMSLFRAFWTSATEPYRPSGLTDSSFRTIGEYFRTGKSDITTPSE